ncbi:MAG TPA: DUF2946 family protein [Rhizomicrobium sp.]
MGKFRSLAVTLTLVAMLLRGFMPMGWMPDAQGGFTICSIDGAHHTTPDNQPAKQDHGDMACPFAAAAHLSAPPIAAILPAPHHETAIESLAQTAEISSAPIRHSPNAPRAPPFLA